MRSPDTAPSSRVFKRTATLSMSDPDRLSAYNSDAETVAVEFNDAINFQSVADRAELMTDDHRFVDSAGQVVEGKAACLDAWTGFFAAYPDYRNEFENVVVRDRVVTIRGRSVCSVPELDGPALWSARVADGKVSEWRVHEDNAANRGALNL
jgi:ketosteroid isomerase-like protein